MIGRRWWVPWLWLAPTLVLLAVFLVYPMFDTLRRSLMDARSETFIGLANYSYILENPQPFIANTHNALLNNILWLLLFPAITVPLGLGVAVLAGKVRYEAAVTSSVFIPMAISFVAASVIWRFMYDFNTDIGTVNAVVTAAGGEPTAWLQNTNAPQTWFTDWGPETLPGPIQINNISLVLVGVWMWTGFATVVLAAGLKGISADVLEAARVDGANEWQTFRYVTLPILTPTIVVVATTLVIQALKKFDLVWVMTGGRFETDVVATLFFKEAFVLQNFGVGAALAVVLMLWVVPIMLISIKRFQYREDAG